MAPKEDLRQKIADALNIDISALSDINIQSYEDVMQILFQFEEEFGMMIERTNDITSLVFDNHNKDISTLISYLYTWYIQRKEAKDTDGVIKNEASDRYHHWKARFPIDINNYWNEQLNKINVHYEPIVDKIRKTQNPIVNLSDFIRQIRSMI